MCSKHSKATLMYLEDTIIGKIDMRVNANNRNIILISFQMKIKHIELIT